MPSLRDALSTVLSSYSSANLKPPVTSILPNYNKQSVYLRCILPPFNADVDSLQQFNNGSQSPKVRVMPLPVRSTIGGTLVTGGGTSVSGGSSSSSSSSGSGGSGGSGSGGSGSAPLPLSVFLTTSLLPAGSYFTGSLTLSQSFQLISVSANAACEVRLYGTALAQAFDASRTADSPVPPEITSNIISCVNLDSVPYTWPFQNRIAANQDSPQGKTLYVTVLNTDPSLSEAVTVTIVYVPLET